MSDMQEGKLTISRVRSSHDDGYVEISVVDEISGCRAFTVRCSVLDFSEALMAHGFRECEFRTGSIHVGKKREIRDIVLKKPPYDCKDDEAACEKWVRKYAPKELTNGWQINNHRDLTNHHNWVGQDKVRITLIRFVDATPTPTRAE